MSVSRMFEMLYILLERDRVTAAELAERLEEDKSTMLAALHAMQQTGADDGQTLRRLSAFLGGDAPDWVRIDLADWSGTQDSLIATLKTAILNRSLLAFDYYGEAGCSAARKVCPFTLWFKGRSWYLHAYCLTRGAMRTFKLSRIRRAHIAEGEFPPEAYAAASAGAPGDRPTSAPLVPLVLRVDGCMAFRVLDDFREEEIARLEDGSFLIRTAFPPGEWLVSFILGYGGHAEVLAPEETRRAVRAALLGALARYDEKNSSRNAKT